jgi:hypothetical protein
MVEPEVIRIVVTRTPLVKVMTGRGAHGETGDSGIHASRDDWLTNTLYAESDWVYHIRTGRGKGMYRATSPHLSAATTEPEVGVDWATKWERGPEGGVDGVDGADGADGIDGEGNVTGPTTTVPGEVPVWSATNRQFAETGINISSLADGWVPAGETWTYASADDPTFTFTITGDKTAKYYPGMRVKLTQTTVRYFIITKVAYSSPDTTITVYGGTDYDLASAAITLPFFSMVKCPAGFPASPAKWTIAVSNTTQYSEQHPATGVVKNLGSISISAPIGEWWVSYVAYVSVVTNSTAVVGLINVKASLSTANNSESNKEYTRNNNMGEVALNGFVFALGSRELLVATAKTTWYLVEWTEDNVHIEYIYLYGDYVPSKISLVSAYL